MAIISLKDRVAKRKKQFNDKEVIGYTEFRKHKALEQDVFIPNKTIKGLDYQLRDLEIAREYEYKINDEHLLRYIDKFWGLNKNANNTILSYLYFHPEQEMKVFKNLELSHLCEEDLYGIFKITKNRIEMMNQGNLLGFAEKVSEEYVNTFYTNIGFDYVSSTPFEKRRIEIANFLKEHDMRADLRKKVYDSHITLLHCFSKEEVNKWIDTCSYVRENDELYDRLERFRGKTNLYCVK